MSQPIPVQLLCALVCLGAGAAGGILFFALNQIKTKRIIRALSDFLFAVASLAAFLACVQVYGKGDVKFFHVLFFVSGTAIVNFILNKLKRFAKEYRAEHLKSSDT